MNDTGGPGVRPAGTSRPQIDPGPPRLSPSGGAGVDLVVAGELATVTLSRPERLNAQTPATWAALRHVAATLPGSVRVVLVRAAGRAFSAGLDRSLLIDPPAGRSAGSGGLRELAAMDDAAADDRIAGYQNAFGWLARPELVSIAAVQGHAIGAGFQLALACDLRVVSEDAVFTMAEVGLGLVPDLGGTRRLIELVGYSRAMDICLTARPVAAVEAGALGLVSRLVAPADLDSAAAELAATLLARPRNAVIEAKALLRHASGRGQAEQEAAERQAQHRLLRELAGLEP